MVFFILFPVIKLLMNDLVMKRKWKTPDRITLKNKTGLDEVEAEDVFTIILFDLSVMCI